MAHEFLSIYPAKLLEYALAVLYLVLFVPFWWYVQGARRTAVIRSVKVTALRRRTAETAPAVRAAGASPHPA